MIDSSRLLIPKRVTIETIFGCNCKCLMCPIDLPTKRKKGIMPFRLFKNIIDSLVDYQEKFEMMDLYGLGEPLLDNCIFDRIKYVKKKGFRNIGISTNADLLDNRKQGQLLDSGIDTVIFSIDGAKKATHEMIRRGVDFDRAVENCMNIIRKRNDGNYPTRFAIRFIRQDLNRDEWETYRRFWLGKISKMRNDFITAFDAHTWGGEVSTKETVLQSNSIEKIDKIEKEPCPIIFNILYILSDGTVPLCNEDWHRASFDFGKVAQKHPIEIFNCEKFNVIRKMHQDGKKREMDICRECTVLYSFETKEIV